MPTPAKPPAFLLFGGFAGARYPEFRAFLEERRLSLLFVDETDRLPRTAGGASAATAGVAEYLLSTADDLPRILDKVEAWRQRYDIRGYHNLLEAFVVPAAHVGERLGLPGPGRRASFICRDKCLQRTLLPEWSPPFAVFSPAAPVEDFTAFPAVLKPVGRGGGSGVFKVRDLGEVAARLPAYASGETLLLEAFVDGLDFSVESLVRDGVVCFENITEEHADPRGRFLEMGYTLPAVRIPAAMMPRIYAIHRQVLERIGFQTGIAHAEYRLSASGGIYLMEIAARNPGDGLLPMYELSTGRPLEAEILKLALGEPVSYPRPARPVRQIYFERIRSPPGQAHAAA